MTYKFCMACRQDMPPASRRICAPCLQGRPERIRKHGRLAWHRHAAQGICPKCRSRPLDQLPKRQCSVCATKRKAERLNRKVIGQCANCEKMVRRTGASLCQDCVSKRYSKYRTIVLEHYGH